MREQAIHQTPVVLKLVWSPEDYRCTTFARNNTPETRCIIARPNLFLSRYLSGTARAHIVTWSERITFAIRLSKHSCPVSSAPSWHTCRIHHRRYVTFLVANRKPRIDVNEADFLIRHQSDFACSGAITLFLERYVAFRWMRLLSCCQNMPQDAF